ncbi:MAG: hypothetical protein EHM36_03740, partial [Deltaproteobacteria bacterium]
MSLGLDETRALGLNACLSLAFFAQHSGMVRTSFRRWMTRFVSPVYHDALYTVASGFVLLSLVVFWQRSTYTWVVLDGIPRLLAHALFLLSLIGFTWGARTLRPFDMFGTHPILRHLRGKTRPPRCPSPSGARTAGCATR